MYFNDTTWCFLVELENGTICPLDLFQEEDCNALEPFKDDNGVLGCTLGHSNHEEEKDRQRICRVWKNKEGEPFNNVFSAFKPIAMDTFVARIIDADEALFDIDPLTAQSLRDKWLGRDWKKI